MPALLAVFLWLTATAGHFLLTGRFARRTLASDASLDELAFTTALAGIGTLSVVLHCVAVTTGLGPIPVALGLLALHGSLWILGGSTSTAAPSTAYAPGWRGVIEILALVVMTGIVFTWVDVASRSAIVVGTDAAHYHVPVSVNLALGASLFDLPATPHLYPMAGSLVDAWFILPVGDPLIVDLAMCLPFVLLVASVNWIFRLCTGLSGLAWSSWVCVALFSTPLFRLSSLVSADLWFASAFVAATAVLLSAWARRISWRAGLLLGGLAFGLLLGTKTTGTAAAGLVLSPYMIVEVARRLVVDRSATRPTSRGAWPAAVAVVLMLGAGGIWLIRNWYLFGSPIAPAGLTIFGVTIFPGDSFQPTDYLSVLGDLQKDPTYDLPGRASRYIRIWLGEWFVPSIALIALVPVDLVAARARKRELLPVAARALLLLLTVGAGAVLVWLLVGAPWTSLEWTRGLSLRFALPIAALVPVVAFIALFPASWRWYDDRSAAPIALTVLIVGSIWLFYSSQNPRAARYVNVPTISIVWLAVAVVVALAVRWASSRADRMTPIAALLCVALATTWTPMIVRRGERERTALVARERQERSNFLRSVHPDSAARHAYLLTLADEAAAGRQCDRRRFFALSRVDEPLMLQSPAYSNRVFYAGRDLRLTARAAPLAACDYVITTPAVMETEKGAALLATLSNGSGVKPIGAAGQFVVLQRR